MQIKKDTQEGRLAGDDASNEFLQIVWKDKERPFADKYPCSSGWRQSDLIHAFTQIILIAVKVFVVPVCASCICKDI